MAARLAIGVVLLVVASKAIAGGRTGCGVPPHPCDDFDSCSFDFFDPDHPDAGPDGCVNIYLDGLPCTPGPEGCAFCQSGGSLGASCDPDFAVCVCPVGLGFHPQPANSLCARERGFSIENSLGDCACEQDCSHPAANQCSYPDNPLTGGQCLYAACYELGQPVEVDVAVSIIADDTCSGELRMGCGAELYLQWDVDKLELVSFVPNPYAEFDWPHTSFLDIDSVAGTVDLGIGLSPTDTCSPFLGGNFSGGTIARLTFESIGTGPTTGVQFRPHVPPTSILGTAGPLPIHGCDGHPEPDGTQAMVVAQDCAAVGPPVPTISQWGAAATALTMVIAGTVVFSRRAPVYL